MKKRFTITVDVNTAEAGSTSVDRVARDQYMVIIRKDITADDLRGALIPVVAHEIGHAIADEFKITRVLTLHKRFDMRAERVVGVDVGRILHSEDAAWTVADKIYEGIRSRCLGTYTKHYKDDPSGKKLEHWENLAAKRRYKEIVKSFNGDKRESSFLGAVLNRLLQGWSRIRLSKRHNAGMVQLDTSILKSARSATSSILRFTVFHNGNSPEGIQRELL